MLITVCVGTAPKVQIKVAAGQHVQITIYPPLPIGISWVSCDTISAGFVSFCPCPFTVGSLTMLDHPRIHCPVQCPVVCPLACPVRLYPFSHLHQCLHRRWTWLQSACLWRQRGWPSLHLQSTLFPFWTLCQIIKTNKK